MYVCIYFYYFFKDQTQQNPDTVPVPRVQSPPLQSGKQKGMHTKLNNVQKNVAKNLMIH